MPLHPAFNATVVQLRKQEDSVCARASNIVGRACTHAIDDKTTMVMIIEKIIARCRYKVVNKVALGDLGGGGGLVRGKSLGGRRRRKDGMSSWKGPNI